MLISGIQFNINYLICTKYIIAMNVFKKFSISLLKKVGDFALMLKKFLY
jgi:hypothetical protein